MNILKFLLILILVSNCSSTKHISTPEASINAINEVLNHWHKAAADAHFDNYFSNMSKDAVFIGTDATENWQLEDFKVFAKPYFDKGKAWSFKPLKRQVYLNDVGDTAWFDELLDTQMEICRGSGVLLLTPQGWKIQHYVLSMTIPNENVSEVVKLKEIIESQVKRKYQ